MKVPETADAARRMDGRASGWRAQGRRGRGRQLQAATHWASALFHLLSWSHPHGWLLALVLRPHPKQWQKLTDRQPGRPGGPRVQRQEPGPPPGSPPSSVLCVTTVLCGGSGPPFSTVRPAGVTVARGCSSSNEPEGRGGARTCCRKRPQVLPGERWSPRRARTRMHTPWCGPAAGAATPSAPASQLPRDTFKMPSNGTGALVRSQASCQGPAERRWHRTQQDRPPGDVEAKSSAR